jgi:type I restriction enzyme S subunit
MSEDLPEGWACAALNDVLEPGGLFDGPFGSNLKTSDYAESGVRVIRLENVANLRFIHDKHTFITEQKYRDLLRHTVGEGDLIVGSFVDGAVRICVLPKLPTKAIAKADCFCVRPKAEIVDPRFVAYQIGSYATRDVLVEDVHGATRPRITTKQLRLLELRLAPLEEQRRIVERIEELLEQAGRISERLHRVAQILGGSEVPAVEPDRVKQAILLKAFSGELVPTEAALARSDRRTYETAAELLARVTSSRDAKPTSRRAKLGSRKTA